ncbi:hypothetical protein N657DRAFT_568085 [Parathielavia appendiculata]|uniref:Uncharacterized protein n=1 Tax=Parathielavia appendiculata TaxID=2587402 RepID=A0AAN6U504_9PEZI|nr:hypothetical protein N657DRAFT_568085 [Parathielavia appendiculata]
MAYDIPAEQSSAQRSRNNHRDLLLISVPRTASNLFLKVLNIHHQPNVVTNKTAGYFFYDAYMIAARDLQKPAHLWTTDEKTLIRNTYQQCLDRLEELRAQAHRENKIVFAKEHAFWLVNPGTMHGPPSNPSANGGASPDAARDDDVSFRLQTPDSTTPGPERTYSPNNQTLLPDEYLRTWQLAFIIRHPALAWPSMYRAMLKMSKELGMLDEDGVRGASAANMSLAWTRKLFDWYAEQSGGAGPLVVDAHDLIHDAGSVALRFCEATGLDKSVVQFEWGCATAGSGSESESVVKKWGSEGSLDEKAARIMLSTLEASKGIVKDKAPASVDVRAEAVKWRAEFGEEAAGLIEKAVWAAMPDYEYLRERRVRA